MSNIIKDIVRFNREAGLLGKGMDSFAETAYTLEESMEGFEAVFNGQHEDGTMVKPGDPEWVTPRSWSLGLMNQVLDGFNNRGLPLMPEVDELDKAIDLVVFSIGKMAKMGLSEEQIAKAFAVVSDANLAKLGGPVDEHGKQLKPEGWEAPEPKLQKILDERESDV